MQSNKKQILTHQMDLTFHNHSPLIQPASPSGQPYYSPLKGKAILADFRGLTLREYFLRTQKTNHTNCEDNIKQKSQQIQHIEPEDQVKNLSKMACVINLSKRVTKNKTEMVHDYRHKNQNKNKKQFICNHSISFQHRFNKQMPLIDHFLCDDEPSQFCTKNSIDLVSKYSKLHRISINHKAEKLLPKKSTSLVISKHPSKSSKIQQSPNKVKKVAYNFISNKQKVKIVSAYQFPLEQGGKRSHSRLKQILMRMGYRSDFNKTLNQCLRATTHK